MKYLINVLASISVVLNTITGGSYRNTFSARVGYCSVNGDPWAIRTEKWIDRILGDGHCFSEHMNEKCGFSENGGG
ncbi:hypothetical protein [Vibrio casei]|uniref:Uncharacterized protein n=1 Tax=Vibrio casei TaxID=673372 RepID=A0A368LHP5_9VIBR|nr:hypothetical protein [Vibrio casei]RCS70191.1 hypothetical protein CIK83_12055 [Vibrio casei]